MKDVRAAICGRSRGGVHREAGAFLFSADTVREAMEELDDRPDAFPMQNLPVRRVRKGTNCKMQCKINRKRTVQRDSLKRQKCPVKKADFRCKIMPLLSRGDSMI